MMAEFKVDDMYAFEGGEYLALIREEFRVVALASLGLSPFVGELYARGYGYGWFDKEQLARFGWMVTEDDCMLSDDMWESYLVLIDRREAEQYLQVKPFPADADVNDVGGTEMRVGPSCYAKIDMVRQGERSELPQEVGEDFLVGELEKVSGEMMDVAENPGCSEVSSDDAAESQVLAQGSDDSSEASGKAGKAKAEEIVDAMMRLPPYRSLDKAMMVQNLEAMEHVNRRHHYGGCDDVSPESDGYCYMALFQRPHDTSVVHFLGYQPPLRNVLVLFLAAARRGVASHRVSMELCEGVLHISEYRVGGCDGVGEIVRRMSEFLKDNVRVLVGSVKDVDGPEELQSLVVGDDISMPVTPCANAGSYGQLCEYCSQQSVSHHKGNAEYNGNPLTLVQEYPRHPRYSDKPISHRPLETMSSVVLSDASVVVIRPDLIGEAGSYTAYDSPPIQCKKDSPQVAAFQIREEGTWNVTAVDIGGDVWLPVQVDVAGVVLALPAGVKFSVAGGAVFFTGDQPSLLLVPAGGLALQFHGGIAVGQPLSLRAGGAGQFRRWLHKCAHVDPAESEVARYWTRMQVPVAVARFGGSSSEEGPGGTLVRVETSEWSPHSVRRLSQGSMAVRPQLGAAVVSVDAQVQLRAGCGLSAKLLSGDAVVVFPKVGFECRAAGNGHAWVADADDAFVIDAGGPSMPYGFMPEF